MVPVPLPFDLNALWLSYLKSTKANRVQAEYMGALNYKFYSNTTGWTDRNESASMYKLSYQAVTGVKMEKDLVMKYVVATYGGQPGTGYPLYISLHGGGGKGEVEWKEYEAANNGAWKTMYENYYVSNLSENFDNGGKKDGPSAVHIAIRGIVNDWDLHFRPESYVLLERLIRNLLYQDPVEAKDAKIDVLSRSFVDPNRIYLMGFSAGGDAVYRISSNLPDRFTAANMSAGHPGHSNLENLANLPLCLQVGSGDGRDMNPHSDTEAARCSNKLDDFEEGAKSFDKSKEYYRHECFIHLDFGNPPGHPHNAWGRTDELTIKPALIIKQDKLAGQNGWWAMNEKLGEHDVPNNNFETDKKVTNSVNWVTYINPTAPTTERKLRIRDPIPSYVVWNLAGRPAEPPKENLPASWTPKNYCYWLMIPSTYNGNGLIRALYNRSSTTSPIPTNSVWVQTWDNDSKIELNIPVTVLLNKDMLDLSQPIKVYGGTGKKLLQTIQLIVQDLTIQTHTLAARGDPNFIFSARITITGNNVETGPWQASVHTGTPKL